MTTFACCVLFMSMIDLIHESTCSEMEGMSFEIQASHGGRFSKGLPWRLSVQSTGRATLVITKNGKDIETTIGVSSKKLQALKAVLEKEGFFELPKEVGRQRPDASRRNLSVTIGDRTASVAIDELDVEHPKDETDLDYMKRAIRIWSSVRGLFEHEHAFDTRPFEEKLGR